MCLRSLLLLRFILLLPLSCTLPSLSGAKNYYRYTDCAPKNYTCGTMSFTVGYPFQIGTAEPDYCRYPGYYLTCTGGTLLINIDDGMKPFRVKDIDYGNHLLTLVDPKLAAAACPLPNYNFTYNTTIFDYNERSNWLTVYSCSSQREPLPAGIYPIPCAAEMSGQHYYYRLGEDSAFGNCVAVSQVLVQIAAANQFYGKNLSYVDVLDEGFMLRWTAGKAWCSDCVSSGGYCGYNTVAQDEQTCYCPTGTGIHNCSTGNFDSSKMSTRKDVLLGIGGGLFVCLCLVAFVLKCKKSCDFGVVSSKSDVYSYGMMVLEMVGGRKNLDVTATSSSETYFPHYLYKNINQYCVEACGDNGEATETVRKMILIALWCIQTMPDDRPSMSRVVIMLEGDISDLQLPPKP